MGRVVCDERGADARTNVEKAAADVDGEQYPKIKLMPTVDSLQELHQALVGRRATEVVVALDPADSAALSEVTRLLTIAHVPFQVVPSLFEQTYGRRGCWVILNSRSSTSISILSIVCSAVSSAPWMLSAPLCSCFWASCRSCCS